MTLLAVAWACSGPASPPASPPQEEVLHPPIPPEDMVQKLIGQNVLDHASVAAFLHPEVPGNLPLTVFPVPELALGAPQLTVGGRPVRVVASPEEARFRFRSYEEHRTEAQVRVGWEIPAEGASGHVDLELRDWVWTVTGAEASER